MSEQNVIEVANLSKKYRLGVYSADTLVEDFKLWVKSFRTEKTDTTNDNDERVTDGLFWALRDINFNVRPGEILAIIGKNGAGKSTLLKLLSKITSPTTGVIKIKGRVASLLEVGTGFHPELTGRENIFLNGAILGMSRTEIKSRLDEIIDFSGVESHIDSPVKRYSSGMKVRLGFAVAAHLEPEILVIDEVLAVGDAEFQRKCLGKIESVSQTGRTVLFVSHNMTAVRNLCTRALLLEKGRVVFEGNTQEAVTSYLGGDTGNRTHFVYIAGNEPGVDAFKILEIEVKALTKKRGDAILTKDPVEVRIRHSRKPSDNRYDVTLQFKGESGEILFSSGSGIVEDPGYKNGEGWLSAVVPGNLLNTGVFEVNVMVIENRRNLVFKADSLLSFIVVNEQEFSGKWQGKPKGELHPLLNWTYDPS